MYNIRKLFSNIQTNLYGINLKNKIVVIESDDWGGIRMTSKESFDVLKNAGIPVQNSAYCRFDKLENNDDVFYMLEVLNSVKNRDGQTPKMTANFVVTNPDFNKIKLGSHQNYYFEPITSTYKRLNGHEKVLEIIRQGISEELILPQFHGRDHVNVPLWLELINKNDNFKLAFELGIWGLSKDVYPNMDKSIQATYDSNDLNYCNQSIKEGLNIFVSIFGFKSKSFIANNYIWPSEIENTLFEGGVKHIQGMKYQLYPLNENKSRNKKRIYFGYKNKFSMTYGVRNCSFEPTEIGDDYTKTLSQIKNAFLFNKPAIISTHRINFSGGMCIKQRDTNLQNFQKLLSEIIKNWPDVKFCTSDQLPEIIKNDI